MNKNIKKLNSKKGMTLVELLVGVAIVVIVFAGTIGAMVGGYSTTVNNADHNKVDATNQATNEIIMGTVKSLGFSGKADAQKCINQLKVVKSIPESPESSDPPLEIVRAKAIQGAAENRCSGIEFVDKTEFPKDDVDCQYTIIVPDTPTKAGSKEIDGVIIKTAMKSSAGFVVNQSFVPYAG